MCHLASEPFIGRWHEKKKKKGIRHAIATGNRQCTALPSSFHTTTEIVRCFVEKYKAYAQRFDSQIQDKRSAYLINRKFRKKCHFHRLELANHF